VGIQGLAEEFSEVSQSTILAPLAGNHSLLASWGTWYKNPTRGRNRKIVNDKTSEGSETKNLRVESVCLQMPKLWH
jgi:hypothetical protein